MALLLGLLLLSTLPGSKPLETTGDPVVQMVAGMTGYLEQLTAQSGPGRSPK